MALIQTDASQNKKVIVLLIILGAAIAATVFRMTNQSTVTPTVEARDISSTAAPAKTMPAVQSQPARNPFRRILQPAPNVEPQRAQPELPAGDSLGRQAQVEPWRMPGPIQIRPLDINSAPDMPQVRPPSSESTDIDKSQPRFVLLATVASGHETYGILSIGEAETRIVKVGDVLDEGFRVIALSDAQAVLTNGRDMIIAKRPES